MNNVTPLVSVIIPCFNAERYILETLDSVYRQGIESMEVIVIDDGSTDQSAALVRQHYPQVRLIQKGPRGVAQARNLGLSSSQGTYIQFLDADDLLMPEKIKKQLQIFQTTSADIVYGNWQAIDCRSHQMITYPVIARKISSMKVRDIIKDFWVPMGNPLFKASFIRNRIEFIQSLTPLEDVNFLIRAFDAAQHVEYLPWMCCQYRLHPSQASRKEHSFFEGILKNSKNVYDWLVERKVLESATQEEILRSYKYSADFFYTRNSKLWLQAVDLIHEIEPRYVYKKPIIKKIMVTLFGGKQADQWENRCKRLKRWTGLYREP